MVVNKTFSRKNLETSWAACFPEVSGVMINFAICILEYNKQC